jgi:arylsulfatase A-like enzyme
MYATQTGAMHMRNGNRSEAAESRNPNAYADIPLYEAVPPSQVRCCSEYLRAAGYYATNNAKQDYQFVAPPTAWDESSNRAHYRSREKGQPFFAVFNCTYTHEGQTFPRAPKRADVVKPADVPVPPYYPDTPLVRQNLAHTYNNIVAMDAWVGERLAELERDGLLETTIVFFFSDHGVGLPRGKRNSYESGLRVPLIVRFPDGNRAGMSDDRLISFLDFAPTLLSLTGLKVPDHLRGRPFLGAAKADPPHYVFATQDRVDAFTDCVRSISDGRYRFNLNLMPEKPQLAQSAYRDRVPMMKDIHAMTADTATPAQWQMVSKSKPREEFYDSQADPHNVTNLIDAPAHAERINAMRAALDAWMKETGDLAHIRPESRLVREKLWPPDGNQPTTAAPRPAINDGALTITCATDGASIGWRRRGERAWRVYVEPVKVDDGLFEAVAHRIGFKPSEVVATER